MIELDGERQKITAAERAAEAQFEQRIFEQPRRGLEPGELECRSVAPDEIDFIEHFFKLVAKRFRLARRLLQDLVDGVHRCVGPMQEGAEARGPALQDAAQYLGLSLHLGAQIVEFAIQLHARGDVADVHQPRTRFAGRIDGVESERIVGRLERTIRLEQPDLYVLERIGRRGFHGLRGVEEPQDESPRGAQSFRRDDRTDQPFKGEIVEILPPEQRGQRTRYLRQDFPLGIE